MKQLHEYGNMKQIQTQIQKQFIFLCKFRLETDGLILSNLYSPDFSTKARCLMFKLIILLFWGNILDVILATSSETVGTLACLPQCYIPFSYSYTQ